MATYKTTIPITIIVEINDENIEADHRPALHGDLPIVAVRRAISCLLSGPLKERKRLGVRCFFINGKWENFPVELLGADARYTAFPARKQETNQLEETREES